MFDRDTHNRLQINNNQANVIKKQIAFFFYIISLIVWSFILPTPIYFSLCGIIVIGTVVLHMFPELDDKLARAADWLSRKWSQLVNSDAEPPAQELLLSPSIEHSLIHRRLSQQSIDSNNLEEDNVIPHYDERSVRYGQLFEDLLGVIELHQSGLFFSNAQRNNNR